MNMFMKTALGAILALSANAAIAQERTLTFNAYQSPKAAPVRAFIMPFAEQVEAATNGRIKVNVPAASLAPPPGQYQIVEQGVADLAIVVSDFEGKRLKLAQITSVPGTGGDSTVISAALWATHKKFFDAANEYKGTKLLAMIMAPTTQLQSRGDAMLTLADVAGKKIRSQPGVETDLLRFLGATPVDAPINEAFDMMSKGIVDGTTGNSAGAVVWNFAPSVKNVTEFPGGLHSFSWNVVINIDTWNSLSAEDQAVVAKIAEDLMPGTAAAADEETEMFGGIMKKGGTQFHPAGDDLAAKANEFAQQAKAEWIATANGLGVDGQAAYDFFISQIGK